VISDDWDDDKSLNEDMVKKLFGGEKAIWKWKNS
jgi:hypothetical protein